VISGKPVCKLGELGVVAEDHHAVQLAVEPANDGKQALRTALVDAVVDRDVLARVADGIRNELRRRQRTQRGARHEPIGLHPAPAEALAHHRRVVKTAIVQRPVPVGQGWIVSARLGMPDQEQGFHTAFFPLCAPGEHAE
jgi:hypothetical protein